MRTSADTWRPALTARNPDRLPPCPGRGGEKFRNPTMTFPDPTSRHAHAGNSSRQRIITRVLVSLSIVCAIAAIAMGMLGIQALMEW
jgi:hypothetical protein